jgi:hypothetical protein
MFGLSGVRAARAAAAEYNRGLSALFAKTRRDDSGLIE